MQTMLVIRMIITLALGTYSSSAGLVRSRRLLPYICSWSRVYYVTLNAANQKPYMIRRLLTDLRETQGYPTVLMEDNQGAFCSANKQCHTQEPKTLPVHVHKRGSKWRHNYWSAVVHEMIADILTKPLQELKPYEQTYRYSEASITHWIKWSVEGSN